MCRPSMTGTWTFMSGGTLDELGDHRSARAQVGCSRIQRGHWSGLPLASAVRPARRCPPALLSGTSTLTCRRRMAGGSRWWPTACLTGRGRRSRLTSPWSAPSDATGRHDRARMRGRVSLWSRRPRMHPELQRGGWGRSPCPAPDRDLPRQAQKGPHIFLTPPHIFPTPGIFF